jgi:glycosyltransferase involved in cell wall biosynthesis
LGKISQRKNQTKYQSIPGVDFIGNIEDTRFDTGNPNYLGEWSRNQIHACLTDYTNLLLLSKGEADALVIKEALVCGLGVVVNRTSAENLDIGCDFITIIEDTHMDDLSYIKQKIDENSAIVRQNRNRIRDYGVANFDIGVKVAEYVNIVSEICTQNNV